MIVNGYSGGEDLQPAYESVLNEETGRTEVVNVSSDPGVISAEAILRVHLSTHDPTTRNQQGVDLGAQYRSILFYRNEAEKTVIERPVAEYREKIGKRLFTEIKPFEHFHPAEAQHQRYYCNHSDSGYCETSIEPERERFRKRFSHFATPVSL